jgi:sugar lactone lactonase YvrE
LLTGLAFGESPRWHDGRLWVADWGAKEILAVDLNGRSEVIVKVDFPTFPMCFDWLPTGELLILSSREGKVLRLEPGGTLVTHADLTSLGKNQFPWNEIVVDGRGNAYLNNQGFQFPGGAFAPGTIALLTPDGSTRQVADGIAFPNGMAVTPDGGTLIVAESYGNKLTAFAIDASGDLANRREWAETGSDHPDGICLDSEGALWYADVANKHCVRAREGGEVLQTIAADRGCFACMLGGANGKTLFIVTTEWKGVESNMADASRTGQILAMEAPVPHAGWP